ncbi:MAG: hypothetical protein ACTTJ4_08860 [Treponema sp.]
MKKILLDTAFLGSYNEESLPPPKKKTQVGILPSVLADSTA